MTPKHVRKALHSLLLAPFFIHSAPLLATTAGVPGPGVTAGDRSVEYRASHRPGDGGGPWTYSHRLHYQHALDDSRRLRVIAQQSKTEGRDWELRYTRLEYQWQYKESDAKGVSSAFRFDLQLVEGDDEPHFARVAWTTQFNLFSARTRLNAFVSKDFGDRARDGLSLATRAEMTWSMGRNRLGFQMFNNLNTTDDIGGFDEQRHQIGPVLTGGLGDWRWFASYLAGISDRAPDSEWRFFFGRSL